MGKHSKKTYHRNYPPIKSPMGRGRGKKHKIFYQFGKKKPGQKIHQKIDR